MACWRGVVPGKWPDPGTGNHEDEVSTLAYFWFYASRSHVTLEDRVTNKTQHVKTCCLYVSTAPVLCRSVWQCGILGKMTLN